VHNSVAIEHPASDLESNRTVEVDSVPNPGLRLPASHCKPAPSGRNDELSQLAVGTVLELNNFAETHNTTIETVPLAAFRALTGRHWIYCAIQALDAGAIAITASLVLRRGRLMETSVTSDVLPTDAGSPLAADSTRSGSPTQP
jgi:hypothetical protein